MAIFANEKNVRKFFEGYVFLKELHCRDEAKVAGSAVFVIGAGEVAVV